MPEVSGPVELDEGLSLRVVAGSQGSVDDPGEGWTRRMKVRYRQPDGWESTAYLDDEPVEENVHVGTNKHTDEPVKVRWNGVEWVQIG